MKGKPRRSLTVFKGLPPAPAPPDAQAPDFLDDSMFQAGLGMLFTTRAWSGAGPLRGNSLVEL
jgi:hypothetical protein